MRRVTLGSLFDGSGTAPLAAEICGFEPVWASEVEPFAIKVTQKNFPNMKHVGDITKLNGAELEPVDIICGGSPCFPKGTLVLCESGYKPIEEIHVGEKVYTHLGNWKTVERVGSKISDTVMLRGNHYGIECTPNHPIFGAEIKWHNNHVQNKRVLKSVDWVEAKDMEGKHWAVPIIERIGDNVIPQMANKNGLENKPPEINENLFYIIGRYLGDGWLRTGQRSGRPIGQASNQMFICEGYKDDYETLEKRMRMQFDRVGVIKEPTVVKMRITNAPFVRWMTENFGQHSNAKKIPAWVYFMPEAYQKSLLNGYCDSDGSKIRDGWNFTTVSKELAHGIRLLAEQLGYSCTVFFIKTKKTTVIEGRTVNQRDSYNVRILPTEKRRTYFVTEKHKWYKVRNVDPCRENVRVYNIQVEDDHSYVVEGFCVHNCQDLSVAGKRAGLIEGERSNLFFEMKRVIKEMRDATHGEYPKYVIWENVDGARSSNKGYDFLAVIQNFAEIAEPNVHVPEPKSKGGKLAWAKSGEVVGNGWSFGWRTVDAQYWGVPQRRKRLYAVLCLGSERAGEILFKREGLRRDFKTRRDSRKSTAGDSEESTGEADRKRAIMLESHPTDSRVKIAEDGIVQTLNARMGTGGVMCR